MLQQNVKLLNFHGLIISAYHNKGNNKAVIYCKGGPDLGDNGENEVFSSVSKDLGISVFIPDYYGSGRSSGRSFTISKSVETIHDTEALLTENGKALDCWSNKDISFNFNSFEIMGHSWGCTMTALYPIFFPYTKTERLNFISGVLNYDLKAHIEYKDEGDAEFWQQILNGWSIYFRNIEISNWKDLILGSSKEYNPLDNIESLKKFKIRLVHGKKDEIVSYKRSELFYNKIKKIGIDATLNLVDEDHFSLINKKLFEDF